MQSRSSIPLSWGKVVLAILPGLFALATSWVVSASALIPITGLGLCVLLSVAGFVQERQLAVWSFPALGILILIGVAGFFALSLGPLLLLPVLAAIFALLIYQRRGVNLPGLVWLLLCLMIVIGVARPAVLSLFPGRDFYWSWLDLAGDGAMLLVVAVGLPLAKRRGLLAGLLVLGAGFYLWEGILDLTYGLWNTPWGTVMVVILALSLLVISPIWVLRSRSTRGQVWGLLLPAFIALVSVVIINAVVRTDPAILDGIVNVNSIVPATPKPWIGVGVRGRENLVPLSIGGGMTAAQLFMGLVLAVVLYDWVQRRDPAAANTQEDRGALTHRPTTATAHKTA